MFHYIFIFYTYCIIMVVIDPPPKKNNREFLSSLPDGELGKTTAPPPSLLAGPCQAFAA